MGSHEKKNCHRERTVWAHGDHGGHGSGPNDHGSVTARRSHSSVTARSQLNHGIDLQCDHGSVTARSQLNHGPGHGSVTAGCDHFGHRELTVSSLWAHGEQSRWPFSFSWAANALAPVARSAAACYWPCGIIRSLYSTGNNFYKAIGTMSVSLNDRQWGT